MKTLSRLSPYIFFLCFSPLRRLNLTGGILYFERLTLKTLIEKRTSEVFWNKVTAILWGMLVVNYTYCAYRAGNTIDLFHIMSITLSSMVFVMDIYDWYYSIQRLKMLTKCVQELEALCDNYFKDFPRD